MKVFNDYSKLYTLFQHESFWAVVKSVYVRTPAHRRVRFWLGVTVSLSLALVVGQFHGVEQLVGLVFVLPWYCLFVYECFNARIDFLTDHDPDDVKIAWVLQADFQNVRIDRFVDNARKVDLEGTLEDVLTLVVTMRETQSSNQLFTHPGPLAVVTWIVTLGAAVVGTKHPEWAPLLILLFLLVLAPSIAYFMVKSRELNRHKEFERFLRCALLD